MSERTIFDPDTKQEIPSLASIKYWMNYVREQVSADIEMLSPPQAEEAERCFDACLKLAEREHLRLQGGAKCGRELTDRDRAEPRDYEWEANT